ncbi:MAG TPA: FG-GAP-like repeat-containing protein [Candidatus Angelobacter sp.]|jgi:RHS repeat-associated protein|nr:FG-GAP-like repeat-containing protein [Candidatus Angelobacter sp.]
MSVQHVEARVSLWRRAVHSLVMGSVLLAAMSVEILQGPASSVASAAGPTPAFGSPVAYANGAIALNGVAVANDKNGGFDIVTANATAGNVSSLQPNRNSAGVPDGTFGSAVLSTASPGVVALASGDFNGDGIPDLVVATGNNTLSVMMGQGNGAYGPVTALQNIPAYNVGTPQAVFARVADLNGDGKQDVVVAVNTGCVCQAEIAVWVALGNGDGTFQPGAEVNVPEASLGSNPSVSGLAVADVTHDGKPDIVVALNDTGHGFDDGQFWVLVNQGNGTFAQGVQAGDAHGIRSSGPGEAMASADLNGDGAADVVTVQQPLTEASRGIHVFLNQGSGTFSTGTYIADPNLTNGTTASGSIHSIAIVDVNGDKFPDIVTAVSSNLNGNGISLYVNNGDGTFAAPVFFSTPGFSPDTMAIADVNQDGKPDLVLGSQTNGNNLHVMLNQTGPVGGDVTDPESRGGGSTCWPCLAKRLDRARNRGRFPISLPFGTFWHSFSDVYVPARGFPLAVTQTYNSSDATDYGLGPGWSSSLFSKLVVTGTSPNQSVTVTAENGSQVVFHQSGTAWTTAPRIQATLVQNGDGTWTFTRGGTDTMTFNPTGQIVSEQDLNGNVLRFAYTGGLVTGLSHDDMAHSDVRSLSIVWNTATPAHITSITDNNAGLNRQAAFTYDTDGQLTDIDWTTGGLPATDINEHFEYETSRPLSHRLTGMRDGRGFWVTQAYDTLGRVTSQTIDPTAKDSGGLNEVTTYDYSVPTQVTVTDPKGNRTTDTYSYGLLMSRTLGVGSPQAATWQYSYDMSTIGPTSVADPNGHTTRRQYDSYGNELSVTDALNHQTTTQYSTADAPFHQPTTVTDALGVMTTYTYDSRRNLTSVSTPLVGSSPAQTQTTTYYRDGTTTHPDDVTRIVDPGSNTWSYGYDAYGDVTSARDPLQHMSTSTFNADGWRTASTTPRGHNGSCNCAAQFTTTYSYTDPVSGQVNYFGDARVVTDPLGHSTTYGYDAQRNLTSVKDGDGNVTSYAYDAAGQQTTVTRPDSSTLRTQYAADGTTTRQIDGANNATSYGYDALGRVTSVTDPLNRTTSMTYDGTGNRLAVVDAQSQTTTYAYNADNQVTSIQYSDGVTPNVTSIAYDADGQRTGMTDGTGTSSYVWDSLHRMTSSTDGAGNTVSYGYDLRGELTSLTYPGVTTPVTYTYDPEGNILQVTDFSGSTAYVALDFNGNTLNVSFPRPSQTIDFYTYNNADQLTGQSFTVGNLTTYASLSYARDGNGQVTSETDTGLPAPAAPTYTYNSLNQLSSSSGASYTYDAADNPVKLAGGATQAFNAGNQLCWASPGGGTGTCTSPPSGATAFNYDSRGNRTYGPSPVGTLSYGYDQANRLTAVSQGPTAQVSMTYNGDGLRITKVSGVGHAITTHNYVWDVHGALPRLLADGTTRFIYGPGGTVMEQVNGSTASYFHHDQLGSTRAITDGTDTPIATYSYDAYGNTVGSTGTYTNSFHFAGEYLDSDTGLYYLRARYYDPSTAQFLTRDPAAPTTRAPYDYVGDNPLNGSDPIGLDSNCSIFAFWASDWCAREGAGTTTGKVVIGAGVVVAGVATGGVALGWYGAAAGAGAGAEIDTTTVVPAIVNDVAAASEDVVPTVGAAGEGPISTGLQRQICEHLIKLNDYIQNPLNSDTTGRLANAINNGLGNPNSIYEGRINHLLSEIRAFNSQ